MSTESPISGAQSLTGHTNGGKDLLRQLRRRCSKLSGGARSLQWSLGCDLARVKRNNIGGFEQTRSKPNINSKCPQKYSPNSVQLMNQLHIKELSRGSFSSRLEFVVAFDSGFVELIEKANQGYYPPCRRTLQVKEKPGRVHPAKFRTQNSYLASNIWT